MKLFFVCIQYILVSFRYNKLCFLNAAFRTANLEIPLYFLVVKTNVSYACVATIMMQYEDAASITEALEKLKEQLNDVTLKAFMLDMNQAEIEAVRKVFPGTSSRPSCTLISTRGPYSHTGHVQTCSIFLIMHLGLYSRVYGRVLQGMGAGRLHCRGLYSWVTVVQPPPPRSCGQTDTCENITFPHASECTQ